jgi:predicted metal-dependent phosphoesterase TrpH
MILDLHTHSDLSEDSRAPIETYLKWLQRKRALLPIDGIVLTEHRQWNPHLDYRALEDKYGVLILRGAEVETDYGHMLLYGVTGDLTQRFDFADVRLPAPLIVHGVVTEKHASEHGPFVECDLLLETADGDRLVTGTATVELPTRAARSSARR